MPLGTFAPGEYTITWNSVACGLLGNNGARLSFQFAARKINNTTTYGDTEIDKIYRGIRMCRLLVVFKEWNAACKAAIWPWGTPGTPAFDGLFGKVGILGTTAAKVLVLTAVSGTPAATNGPATLTAGMAVPSEDNAIEILMGPDERDVPVLFDLLPYDVGSGVIKPFVLT